MAHRKPIGSTCRARMDWRGERPIPGDYLVSGAGTWYRVQGVEETSNPFKLVFQLERVNEPPAELQFVDGTVLVDDVPWMRFHFEWHERSKQRA